MHVGRVGGTLDVRVVAHAPAEVVHGQHRPLVHALGAQVLVICGQRGGGCRQGSLPPKKGDPQPPAGPRHSRMLRVPIPHTQAAEPNPYLQRWS